MAMSDGERASSALLAGSWYCALPPALQASIVQCGRVRKLELGEVLFRQGDPSAGLHAILSGQTEVTGLTSDGAEILIALLRPGEWTGVLASLDEGPYAFTATAVEPTEILSLSLAHVRRLFDNVEALRALMKLELMASRRVYRFMVDLATMTPLQRLARRLLDLAHAAYDDTCTSDQIDHVSQKQIAVSIMCSRQLTNHMLRRLEEAGLITLSREHIVIRNRAGLEACAREAEATI